MDKILKITSGSTPEIADFVDKLYNSVLKNGTHRAPTIKVAEAAKILENTQRDVNIALMNEITMIFNALQIDTQDVLAAAGTKWNFLHFSPGLVGGHCISVDPYYLIDKAMQKGVVPRIIIESRRVMMPWKLCRKSSYTVHEPQRPYRVQCPYSAVGLHL